MRTKLYLLPAIAIALCLQANAKIWRLNNNGGGTLPLIVSPDFPSATTLQQAHDNASVANGDTLHLEQSATSYGNCTFTKRLVVIGAGYFLNLNPKTQVNKDYNSIVGQLTLQNAGAAGTVITGLTQSAGSIWYVGANNVTISRSRFNYAAGPRLYLGSGTAASCDGINILQNYFDGASNTYTVQNAPSTTGNVTNLSIIGNIIGGYQGISLGANSSGIFKNNTISVSYTPISLVNFYVANNMSYSTYGYGNSFDNSTIEYNMGTVAVHFVSPGGSANTISSGNQTVALASWNLINGPSTDSYYQLTASSPAKGSGKNGDDMGAFGGQMPYKLSGIAAVPNIYSMTIGAIAPGASSISVTVGAKSNN